MTSNFTQFCYFWHIYKDGGLRGQGVILPLLFRNGATLWRLTPATSGRVQLLQYTHCIEHVQFGCVAQLAERRSLAGELTFSCARPAADRWSLCG